MNDWTTKRLNVRIVDDMDICVITKRQKSEGKDESDEWKHTDKWRDYNGENTTQKHNDIVIQITYRLQTISYRQINMQKILYAIFLYENNQFLYMHP